MLSGKRWRETAKQAAQVEQELGWWSDASLGFRVLGFGSKVEGLGFRGKAEDDPGRAQLVYRSQSDRPL